MDEAPDIEPEADLADDELENVEGGSFFGTGGDGGNGGAGGAGGNAGNGGNGGVGGIF